MKYFFPAVLAAVCLVIPIHANATPLLYNFTFTDALSNVLTFALPFVSNGETTGQPDQKTDTSCPYIASSAVCMSTTVTVNGVDAYDTVEFLGSNSGGGVIIMPAFQKTKYTVFQTGTLDFHGNTSMPNFFEGTFNSTNVASRNAKFGSNFTLTVKRYVDPPVVSAPEPSSLFLFGTGLMSMAGLLYRKIAA